MVQVLTYDFTSQVQGKIRQLKTQGASNSAPFAGTTTAKVGSPQSICPEKVGRALTSPASLKIFPHLLGFRTEELFKNLTAALAGSFVLQAFKEAKCNQTSCFLVCSRQDFFQFIKK